MNVNTIITDSNGQEWSAEVMRIKNTRLGIEDHGICTAYLHCKGNGVGTGVGGYSLDDKPSEHFGGRRIGSAYGLDWIMEVCKTIGVEAWEDLPGKAIYILYDKPGHWGQVAKGIANIDTGKALIFEQHSDLWKEHAS